jgi:hypothetical protein
VPEGSLFEDKVVRNMMQIILLYLVSLGLQRAVSGDKVFRYMKLTVLLCLVSEGHQRAMYLEMKWSGT